MEVNTSLGEGFTNYAIKKESCRDTMRVRRDVERSKVKDDAQNTMESEITIHTSKEDFILQKPGIDEAALVKTSRFPAGFASCFYICIR